MEEIRLSAAIIKTSRNEISAAQLKVVEESAKACSRSYSPYSHFAVGAAVEMENGEIITASNQENAAFPAGLCAERIVLSYAKSKYPNTPIRRMAISAIHKNELTEEPVSPCGGCRQVMLETANRQQTPIELILAGKDELYIVKDLKDLLPLQFSAKSLE